MALPFRTTGSLRPTFVPARAVTLAVKLAYAFALTSRCPTVISNLRAPPLRFGRRPPQSNYPPDTVLSPGYGPKLEHQTLKGGISTSAPCRLASTLQSLPPILHIKAQCSVSSYSKGSRGLFVLPRVHCIFTASSISLSLGWRQPGHHYAIRAGRNLPDKEFRYLRTVIVTAAVYWGFDQELRLTAYPIN